MRDASLAAAVLETGRGGQPAPAALIEACGFPEIGALLSYLSVRIDPDQGRPLRLDGSIVALTPRVASDVGAAALALREGIELAGLGFGRMQWSHRILAHATAAVYARTLLQHRLGGGLDDAARSLVADGVGAEAMVARPGEVAARIARFLEGRDAADDACPDAEIEAAARALPLALPTEVLLTVGGDDRMDVDWGVGLNSYGVAPQPMPWRAAFGSCTASAPTQRSFDAARHLRQRLIEAALTADLDAALDFETASVRTTVLSALGVTDDAVEVILTPSGTDAELVAAALVMAPGEGLTSILVGPTEIGSGSVPAAGGRHFSSSTPTGAPGGAGRPVDGFETQPLSVISIPIRHDSGGLIDPDDVEAEIDRAIRAAPGRVLLHVVEGSKTGIRLPRAATVAMWQEREGDRFEVVVDAAQMRIDQQTVVDHLAAGRMVFVTGSKFFGGPPFSGAVLVPAEVAERADAAGAVPAGLDSYLTHNDIPERFPLLRRVASPGANYGLVARWHAAVAEMRSFHNASPEIRDHIIRVLARGLRGALSAHPLVEIVESPYTPIPTIDQRGLDDLPTIFTFLVRRRDGRLLDHDEAVRLHRLLMRDSAELVPSEHRRLATRCFFLGQPVRVVRGSDRWCSALRFAIGATTVSNVVFDYTRGERWEDRIESELADVAAALDKLTLVLDHVDLGADGGA